MEYVFQLLKGTGPDIFKMTVRNSYEIGMNPKYNFIAIF